MGVCMTKGLQVVDSTEQVSVTRSPEPAGEDPASDFTRPPISLHPPANFYPDVIPITERERRCRKVVCNMKSMLGHDPSQNLIECWKEEGTLSAIQSSVLSISALHLASVKDLAHALASDSNKYLEGISGQSSVILAKAYAIYFWIINNTQSHLVSENQGQRSSYDYASLFDALCAEVGLNSKKIEGHLRGWRCYIGEEFCPNESNYHCWNVVITGSRPILVDCALGSKFRNLNCYFDPLPEHLIFTHWPTDSSKQYLRSPLLLQELQPVIPLPMTTRHLGLQPSNWSEVMTVLKASPDPVAVVSFSLAAGTTNSYVTADLIPHLSSEVARGQDELQRHTYITKTNSNEFNVQTVLPTRPGKFFLNIYLNEIQCSQSQQLCLSYLIESEASDHDARIGYPLVYPSIAKAFDCTLKYWNTGNKSYRCVNSISALLSLVFEASSDISFYHCLIRGRSTGPSESKPDDVYDYQTALANNSNLYKLVAIFPEEGWWTLYISGTTNFDGVTSGSTSLLTYQVFAEKGSRKLSYPRVLVPDTVIVPSDPITAMQNDVTTVPFATSTPLNFFHYLTAEQPGSGIFEGYSNVELDKERSNTDYANYLLNVVFPNPGTWTVHVFNALSNGVNEGLFQLKVTVDDPLPNTLLLHTNTSFLKEYNITLMKNGIVTFADDGQPFSFEFMAPAEIDFLHELKSPNNSQEDYCTHLYHQHNTMQQSTTTSTLSATFPSPGKWTLELFASKAGEDNYNLVVDLKLDVKNPLFNRRYPKIYPAFGRYGCHLLKDNALVKSTCGSEFKLPFQTSSAVYFSFKLENERHEDFSQQVFVHASPESKDKTLHLIFPECGTWKLIVYASQLEQLMGQVDPILQVCVESNECNRDVSFPLLYQHFYEPYRLSFNLKDLPLPSVVQIGALPQTLHISYYSPPDVVFHHYAELMRDSDGEQGARDGTTEHMATRMVSDDSTGLHRLQVEVAQTGHWTVLLFASNTDKPESPDKWSPVMKHVFYAVRANGNP